MTLKRADQYFDNFAYAKAATLYEAYVSKTPDQYAFLKLAESYVKLNDPETAVNWYQKGFENEVAEARHYLN